MNGVFRVVDTPPYPMPSLDARGLMNKEALLAAIGQALDFPDYYGGNWDALEECLDDLSWHEGPIALLITHTECLPDALTAPLVEIFADAARRWEASDRVFALYLQEGADHRH